MPYNLFTDTGSTFQKLDYVATHLPEMDVPGDFLHTPPSAMPTEPAYPGTLDPAELAEVDAWRDGLVTPTLPDAIAYVTAYETYNAEMDAWKTANKLGRKAQYRMAVADAVLYNRDTEAVSSDPGGTGGTPPPASIYPRNDP